MRKGNAEPVVRKTLSFSAGFAKRMEELKDRRGLSSESELIRQAFALLEATTDEDAELILRNRKTKEETRLLIAS
jgi:Arc/MetJ-type ribon-helix-helix transcriptional regulator